MSDDERFTISDLFGENQARPDHPDFWQLSQAVLGLDAAMTDGLKQGQQVDEVIAQEASKVGDSHSITYMATQRAMRLHGVATLSDLRRNYDKVNASALMYLEGMIMGATLAQGRNDA